MNVKKFEELEIWKEARELCQLVYQVTGENPFEKDYKFKEQIRSASGSIMDNIAEGFDRGGNKEFCQFLSISKGSVAEVRSQAYRAYDVKNITEQRFNELIERTDVLSRKIHNLMQHLKNSDIKGLKYI